MRIEESTRYNRGLWVGSPEWGVYLLLLLVGDDVSVDARLDLLVLGVSPLEVSRVGGVLTQKFLRIN